MGHWSAFVLMLGLAVACGGRSERIPGEGEAGSEAVAGTGGAPGVGGSAPGAGGTIPPGTSGVPEPGTGGLPEPCTGGTPDPGTGGSVNVGGTVAVGGFGNCGGPAVNPNCRGISTGSACAMDGLRCEAMRCGLADVGRRSCDCSGTWACTACDFTGTVYATRPDSVTECTGVEQDALSCPVLGAVCLGAANGEACACYLDDECEQIWDCDKYPPGWVPAL